MFVGGCGGASCGGGGPTVVYNVALSGSDNGWENITFVQLLAAGNLGAATGTQARVTVKFAALPNLGGARVYIGQKAAAGDAYDFNTTPAQVLFGGGNIVGDGVTLTFVSDFVTLPEAYDETKDYLVSVFITNVAGTNLPMASSTGDANYFAIGDNAGNKAETPNKTGYSTNLTNTAEWVTKIEIQ
jgi:hypothetical protein